MLNVQVVAPETECSVLASYDPNGDCAPLGWAWIIVLIVLVMGTFGIEAFDVFVNHGRQFG